MSQQNVWMAAGCSTAEQTALQAHTASSYTRGIQNYLEEYRMKRALHETEV